jgi:LacI family transcriptional regulator
MGNGRTTIKELARRSGVSVGTVSRALNGYDDVSPATRERIMRLAEELDYRPAAAARTLVTQRSHVIGVFLDTGEGHPDLQHPFFHEVLVGLKDQLGGEGYDLLLFASQPKGGYLGRCRQHHVDGAVVMGIEPDDPELRRLARSDVPCVGVDVEISGKATTYVMSDNVLGARAATAHLTQLGHKRIATICGLLDTRPGLDRLRGYREALAEAGLAYRDEYVRNGDFYVESGHREAAALLDLPEPPTAIVAGSDLMAVGALQAAAARGVRVPEDLSIVGFDDIMLAAHLRPGLTTVRQDKAGLGAAAGRSVLSLLGGDADQEPAATTLDVELVVRGTTGPPRGS